MASGTFWGVRPAGLLDSINRKALFKGMLIYLCKDLDKSCFLSPEAGVAGALAHRICGFFSLLKNRVSCFLVFTPPPPHPHCPHCPHHSHLQITSAYCENVTWWGKEGFFHKMPGTAHPTFSDSYFYEVHRAQTAERMPPVQGLCSTDLPLPEQSVGNMPVSSSPPRFSFQ